MLRSAQTDGLASNLLDYPYFEGSPHRHNCLMYTYNHRNIIIYYTFIHIYDGDKDDIAVLVMRNKAIQDDTKPAGRTESVALI